MLGREAGAAEAAEDGVGDVDGGEGDGDDDEEAVALWSLDKLLHFKHERQRHPKNPRTATAARRQV